MNSVWGRSNLIGSQVLSEEFVNNNLVSNNSNLTLTTWS